MRIQIQCGPADVELENAILTTGPTTHLFTLTDGARISFRADGLMRGGDGIDHPELPADHPDNFQPHLWDLVGEAFDPDGKSLGQGSVFYNTKVGRGTVALQG